MNDKAKQALADYRAKVASGEIVPEKRHEPIELVIVSLPLLFSLSSFQRVN